MKLDAVGKRYGLRQPWIVRDVSLDVPAGRLIRLEGRNGSGKSTLLRVLAGACQPTAGRVTGRPRTGYVPERFPPGLPFSPYVYLTHLGRVHGLHGAALAGMIDECLERLGAAGYAGMPMRTLSKGMCQKVAVAQALLPRPGLLVLDEAWTGLDVAARGVLDDEVAARVADGGTVVFVDHDPARLAGMVTERWQVTGGQVRAVAAAPARAEAADAAEAARAVGSGGAAVQIDVTGAWDLDMTGLRGLPGVLSVRAAGKAGSGGVGELMIVAEAGASDAVLRALLARGGPVHIRSVRPGGETGPARPAGGAAS